MSFRRMKAFRILRFVRVAVVAIFLALAAAPAAFAVQTAPPGQSEYVPIKDLPPTEQMPAAPLLIAAYAVVWIVLAVYVWTLWKRFLRAEQDLKQLAGRLPPAR